MKILDYMKANRNKDHSWLTKRIECNDGFSISVQGSEFAYCKPREPDADYYEVECGFPSEKPDLIMGYAERPEDPTGTVYGYVPINLVQELIDLHGGIKSD